MYSAVRKNKLKTVLIIFAFVLLMSALGWVISVTLDTPGFFIPMLIFAITYAGISYFASAKMAIAMTGAKPVTAQEAPRLYKIVENLSISAGMPMPKIYIVNDPAPNAFATGRDPEHGVVAATTGILDILDDSELEGVMAHELSHVQNYDIRVTSIVIALVTIIAFVSDWLLRIGMFGGLGDRDSRAGGVMLLVSIVAAIIAPLIAMMLQLAVSRKREFLADASGALMTRYPEGLASALQKIESSARPMRKANNATAHLFLANPFGREKRGQFVRKLFSTHPPTADRVAQLNQMGTEL
ncbi:MAG: M48 family metallopeptidase [Candidatus Saccharimonadales bacterium]